MQSCSAVRRILRLRGTPAGTDHLFNEQDFGIGHRMANTVTVTPPRHWEDWCDWLLGIWLILSPWALDFGRDPVAMRNAVIVGFLVVLAEWFTLSVFRLWEEWINVLLGLWLILSPWILGITPTAAVADAVITGALIAGLALYEVWEVRRSTAP
jgi:hypothetical protein